MLRWPAAEEIAGRPARLLRGLLGPSAGPRSRTSKSGWGHCRPCPARARRHGMPLRAHSLSRVVLPKPAGAEMRIRRRGEPLVQPLEQARARDQVGPRRRNVQLGRQQNAVRQCWRCRRGCRACSGHSQPPFVRARWAGASATSCSRISTGCWGLFYHIGGEYGKLLPKEFESLLPSQG